MRLPLAPRVVSLVFVAGAASTALAMPGEHQVAPAVNDAPIVDQGHPTPTAGSPGGAPVPTASSASDAPPAPTGEIDRLLQPPGPTFSLLATFFTGFGFRFNNPYRLHTQLGESAKNVSITDGYLDVGAAFAAGKAYGFQHGAAVNLSFGMPGVEGVAQGVLVPAYFALYRGTSDRFLAFGRMGPAIILNPDANVGGEIGLGGAVFLTGHVAVTGEVLGDLFFGAATREVAYPAYPTVSLQIGLLTDYEVLP
jgi:hypothetical protein